MLLATRMRRAATSIGLLFGVILAAANAHAAPRVAALDGPPGQTLAEQPPHVDRPVYTTEPVASPLAQFAADDPTHDRAFGRSTAMSLRPGEFDFSMRTAVEHGTMLSVAAGLTDGLELSVDAGYARNVANDYGVGMKFSVLRRPTYALAVDVSMHSTSEAGSDRVTILFADFKATTCALECNMLVTAGAGIAATNSSYDGSTMPTLELSMIFGGGVVRPMLEGLTVLGDAGASFAFGGVRIGIARHVGVDIGAGYLGISGFGSEGSFGMVVGVGVRP